MALRFPVDAGASSARFFYSAKANKAEKAGTDHPAPHTNDPKQGAGEKKVPFAALPFAVLCEDAVAHGEGALKYGRHNWRESRVLASTYYAAALRHLFAYIEGEDIDPESGVHHLTKCRASLGVLRDAQMHGTAIDDRPSPSPDHFMRDLNQATIDMESVCNGLRLL